jgi:hypothetical protein
LRPVEAIGLTAEGSIQQLTAFDYAGSELRKRMAASCDYAIPARRRGDLGQVPRSKERPPSGGLSGKTGSRVLRPYAGFKAARAIGIRSNSVPVRGIRIKPNVGYCGIGLPETFGTCGLNIHLCGLCRERGCEERDEQSDGEKSSRTEHGCLLEGNYTQRVWWPGTS